MSEVLWSLPEAERKSTQLWSFIEKVRAQHNLPAGDYFGLHQWSIDHNAQFWEMLWQEGKIKCSEKYSDVFRETNSGIPRGEWFPGAKLNYAENLLKRRDDKPALIFANETGVVSEWSAAQLWKEVGRVQQGLKNSGLKRGDRVVGFMPNRPETVVAMLATVGMGAVWSSCSPDFGFQGVMDRFGQIEATVLFASDQVLYNGKWHSTTDKVKQLKDSLPSLKQVVVVEDASAPKREAHPFESYDVFGSSQDPEFEALDFDHPLFIMYSSGTTGVPKCIVHGHGGTLLAHVKEHRLHGDLRPGDTLFYFTTCGWMMWNWLVSGLSQGAALLLYDGSPLQPGPSQLFDLAAQLGVTHFGTSPKFISSVMKSDYRPADAHAFPALRTIYSTGAPLLPEHYQWVYEHWKDNVHLSSISGGTDLIGCFMLGNPLLPVRSGEIQAPGLGLDVQAYDEQGQKVVAEKGELVCVNPFPNMPIGFWDDPQDQKYKQAYFGKFPGVWCHGDFIEHTDSGGVVVLGRSDATLNPGGVRIGTAEIYRQVEKLSWVRDAIAVGFPVEDDVEIHLFVVIDGDLNDQRLAELKRNIRLGASPRHVPQRIAAVADIPRTLSGKKVEKAVLAQLLGETVPNRDALINPEALDHFKAI